MNASERSYDRFRKVGILVEKVGILVETAEEPTIEPSRSRVRNVRRSRGPSEELRETVHRTAEGASRALTGDAGPDGEGSFVVNGVGILGLPRSRKVGILGVPVSRLVGTADEIF